MTKADIEALAGEVVGWRADQPRHVAEAGFAGLFGWDDFYQLLDLQATTGNAGDGLRILNDGRTIPLSEYVHFMSMPVGWECKLSRSEVNRLYADGATILLFRIDRIDAGLSVLCREVERLTGKLAHVQC